MGANAQTTVPTFTTGQVLTADQQNQSARTGVPVFASTTTRNAAFGGANKTLAEGQMCYVEGTGLQTYNGTAWVTWGTSLPTSGLVVVKAETAISAASSVTADNVFTSAYTNYRINLVYNTSTTNDIRLRVRVGGVSASTSYNYQTFRSNGATNTGANTTGDSSFYAGANSNGTRRCYVTIDVSGPALADQTTFQAYTALFQGSNAGQVFLVAGMHDAATAYDGFELLVASGTFSGSYTVYGYGKSL